MACGCSESGVGSTQKSLVAWVQPGGAGPANPAYYAMIDKDWPALKLTGIRSNRRGTVTPIYRRSGDNPRDFVRRGSRTGAPAANTVTLEFHASGCGGFMPNELTHCLMDVYQQHICCGQAGDFTEGWSKIDILAGIDIESDEYSDGVSYNTEDDNDLFVRHTAEFQAKYTIYPLSVPEIAASVGLDTGTFMSDAIFANQENCGGTCGPQLGCADRWYAVSNEGVVIYRKNANSTPTSVTISGFPTFNGAALALLGNKLFVSFFNSGSLDGGFYWASLDRDGDPGTWTAVTVSSFQPNGWVKRGSALILYGQRSDTEAVAYEVDSSAAATLLMDSTVDNSGIVDMVLCGKTLIGVGYVGTIWISGCQDTWSLATSTPTAATIRAVDARVSGEWWIGTSDGRVWYTNDGAQSWTNKVFPFTGSGNVFDIVWANPNVGYVLHQTAGNVVSVYTTWDGGVSWVNGNEDNDRVLVPPDGTLLFKLAVPCCSNQVEQSNSFLIAGDAGDNTGGLWIGQVQNC